MTPAAVTLTGARLPSPVGEIELYALGDALCGLAFADRAERLRAALRARFGGDLVVRPAPDPAGARERLRAYFAGELTALDSLPVDCGGTAFQARVWAALRRIPAGSTRSYGEQARAIGHAAAVRAVGAANGANPVSLIVPCHRVVAGSGQLTGYAGGLDRKRWLLAHEGAPL